MARLTKSDIERNLLTGQAVPWLDANKRACHLLLADSKARRLFDFLLGTKVREPKDLPQDFIDGLSSAYDGTDDPATNSPDMTTSLSCVGPWRLQSIETEGFGGLNIWGGPPFHFDFDQESFLLEGPNGSGKSSLVGGLIWALSGERPRDQATEPAHEAKPVFGANGKQVGNWPPIACYPASMGDLGSPPRVRVQLTFQNPLNEVANVERTLDGGKVTSSIDPGFTIPSVLLETGLLMPARLAHLRLDDGGGQLTDAVQKLTGLDDLVAIGELVTGLCHASREYLSYKRKEIVAATKDFDQAIKEARNTLAVVQEKVPDFTVASTDDDNGEMAQFGRSLTDRAAEHTSVVSNDLADGLDLAKADVQHQVISAIGAAREDLRVGLSMLPSWSTLQSIAQALDEATAERISASIMAVRRKAEEAVRLLERGSKDSKFQLKALAAQWHAQHEPGPIADCPLCGQDLKSLPLLVEDFESLGSMGDAAARKFDDNLNAILAELESSIPQPVKKFGSEILAFEPRAKVLEDFRETYLVKDRYAKTLVKYKAIIEVALSDTPGSELAAVQGTGGEGDLRSLSDRIATIERLLQLAAWFRNNSGQWLVWWQGLADSEASKDASLQMKAKSASEEKSPERLSSHLLRLSGALERAEPFRKATEAIRSAWKAGKLLPKLRKN